MMRINLLPHRELKRKAQQQQFAIFAGIICAAGLLTIWVVHYVINEKIEFQQERNQYLSNQIAVLDKQIAEIREIKNQTQELLARKGVVESLQGNRSEVVHLLDQLVRLLPDGVYLKSIKQANRTINLTGFAQSNAWVSTLMRNLESSPWLESPVLIEIKAVTVNNTRQNEFNLNIQLKPAVDNDSEMAVAGSNIS
ncbi:MAG: PilN domain-containing protein [Burkholderiales bacterium]|uniref:PilN domain-containing protein n=1 Tax=Nitrosomonas sp. TaxID=42353 RepID=UPI001D2B4FEF|nr:PilN domain-containing protein [Nitrosomonas sp.]MCB1947660.1 PilN domain-containing protein [Nitrosomonas sp.]MCP5241964.1 PilN domain-containing protein [Burkholderiales bacterium]